MTTLQVTSSDDSSADSVTNTMSSLTTTTPASLSPYFTARAMPAWYYLAVDIFIHCLQTCSIVGNGFIILLFIMTPRLKRNQSLRLLFLLCVTDFIFAVITLPYIVYYTVKWDADMFDYDPMYIVTSSTPLVVQFKVNLVITIMIAVDRLQAMKMPAYYRGKNQMNFMWLTLALGLCLAGIDLFLEYKTTRFDVRRYNCAAIGCFQEPGFKAYWGISNMTLNTIALLLTFWVAFELNRIRSNNQLASLGKRESRQMYQANKLSFGILLVSFVFLMVPSTFVGVAELAHLHVFQIIGPFYIIGLLLAGGLNSVIYLSLHVEIQNAAIYFKKHRSFNTNTVSVVPIGATTTFVPEL